MKIAFVLILSLILFTGCSQNENTSNYNSERTTYEINIVTNTPEPTPQELFVYKTTIYTKTEARQNNVKLACNQLNNSIVAPGETFSFCDTLRTCKTRRWL